MPVNTFVVDNYKVILSREHRVQGNFHALAAIKCYHTDPEQGRLEIFFLPPHCVLPPNHSNNEATRGTLYAPVDQYAWFIDLLRNENPVYVRISSTMPMTNTLETGFEPAGEGEGKCSG